MIERWIEEQFDSYIALLTSFVAIPSVAVVGADDLPYGKPCSDMLSFIQAEMDALNLETENLDNHVVIGTLKGCDPEGSVIGIACHGDVVAPAGQWEKDPYSLWQKGQWLIGRGATDNKGATIAILFVLRYLKEHNITLKNTINFYVGSAEEIGMPDMKYLTQRRALPDFTLVPDAGFPLCYGEKGRFTFVVENTWSNPDILSFSSHSSGSSVIAHASARGFVYSPIMMNDNLEFETHDDGSTTFHAYGKACHPAFADEGVDAVGILVRALKSQIEDPMLSFLEKLTQDIHGSGMGIYCEDELSGTITAVITKIHLSDEKCLTITYDIRYPVTSEAEIIERTLRQFWAIHGFQIRSFHHSPKSLTELTPSLIRLSEIANEVHGTNDQPYIMGGGTYARTMQPAVAYGMGTPSIQNNPPFPVGEGKAHQPNEAVYIPRMKKGCEIYIRALLALDELL